MKTLHEIHEDVSPNHYDLGIKTNLFQRYWHWRRFSEVLAMIEPVTGPVLDLGCHSGTFTKQILTKIGSQDIYGVDISSSAIALAKKRIPHGKFITGDAEQLPFEGNFFDAVFCLEMMEHVDHPILVISEIKRVAKKGAKIYILIPSDNKLFKIIWFLWTLYYPVWRHAHVQSFSRDSLEKMVTQTGFKILNVKNFNLGMLKLIICQKT